MEKYEKNIIAALSSTAANKMVCSMCPLTEKCTKIGSCQETWKQFFTQTILANRAKQWILGKMQEFINDKNVMAIHSYGGRVCVFAKNSGKIIAPPNFAYSTCSDTDNFDMRIGIAIAYARYCEDKIPHFIYEVTYPKGFLGD